MTPDNLVADLHDVNVSAIALALPKESALIEYVRFKDTPDAARYLAFVLLAGIPDVHCVDLGDATEIEGLVRTVVASLRPDEATRGGYATIPGPPVPSADREAGRALRSVVLDPLDIVLQGRTRLVVAPDGALYALPLEVLPDGCGGHIVDHFCISYIDTGRDVLRFGRPRPTPRPPR